MPGADGNVAERVKKIAELDAADAAWSSFYEPFAGDSYLEGPEYAAGSLEKSPEGVLTEAGTYLVEVFNPDNRGKYVLAIGTREEFTPKDTLNTLQAIPQLKTAFFGKPMVSVFWNLIGSLILLGVLVTVGSGWIIARTMRKRRTAKSRETNTHGDEG